MYDPRGKHWLGASPADALSTRGASCGAAVGWLAGGRSHATALRRARPPLRRGRRFSSWGDGGPLCDTQPHARPEAARRRLRGRPRLPLRLHARVVAALEGPLRGGRRPRRRAVPRPPGRVALVAHRAEPDVRRGRVLRAPPRHRGPAEGRPLPASRRGEPGGRARRPPHTRGDLALGHAAVAAAPRAAGRARAAGRGRRLHRADGPLPRDPDLPARALRCSGRLLRRRRADEPAGVRRHGHRLQLLPRRRPGRVRPAPLELGRRARPSASARRSPGRGGLLGGRPGVLRAAAGRQEVGCLLLRLRRQVPPRMDGGDGGRAVAAPPRRRLCPRRARLPRRHRRGADDRRRAVQRVRAGDLGRAREPLHHAAVARDGVRVVVVPAVRARLGGRGDRREPVRRHRALVRARKRAARRVGRRRGDRRVPRARRRPRASRGARAPRARAGARRAHLPASRAAGARPPAGRGRRREDHRDCAGARRAGQRRRRDR